MTFSDLVVPRRGSMAPKGAVFKLGLSIWWQCRWRTYIASGDGGLICYCFRTVGPSLSDSEGVPRPALFSPVWCPPEQGCRWSQEGVVLVGLAPWLNPLRMFAPEVGQEETDVTAQVPCKRYSWWCEQLQWKLNRGCKEWILNRWFDG